jgi:hypothetical protein
MEGLELLEKYPLAAKVVKDWFMEQMLESFKDETVPEGFKQYMLEQGVENDKVAKMIDANPRMLLDVFDDNEIYISVFYTPGIFMASVNQIDIKPKFNTRKQAELNAIEVAFEILEYKLSPEEEEIN